MRIIILEGIGIAAFTLLANALITLSPALLAAFRIKHKNS